MNVQLQRALDEERAANLREDGPEHTWVRIPNSYLTDMEKAVGEYAADVSLHCLVLEAVEDWLLTSARNRLLDLPEWALRALQKRGEIQYTAEIEHTLEVAQLGGAR